MAKFEAHPNTDICFRKEGNPISWFVLERDNDGRFQDKYTCSVAEFKGLTAEQHATAHAEELNKDAALIANGVPVPAL